MLSFWNPQVHELFSFFGKKNRFQPTTGAFLAVFIPPNDTSEGRSSLPRGHVVSRWPDAPDELLGSFGEALGTPCAPKEDEDVAGLGRKGDETAPLKPQKHPRTNTF